MWGDFKKPVLAILNMDMSNIRKESRLSKKKILMTDQGVWRRTDSYEKVCTFKNTQRKNLFWS